MPFYEEIMKKYLQNNILWLTLLLNIFRQPTGIFKAKVYALREAFKKR